MYISFWPSRQDTRLTRFGLAKEPYDKFDLQTSLLAYCNTDGEITIDQSRFLLSTGMLFYWCLTSRMSKGKKSLEQREDCISTEFGKDG